MGLFHSVSEAPGGSVISQVRTRPVFANVVVCGRWRSLCGGLHACLCAIAGSVRLNHSHQCSGSRECDAHRFFNLRKSWI